MIEVTEADKLATKQHQQRFLTEGRSETELLWEAFAAHRIEAAKAEGDMLRGTLEHIIEYWNRDQNKSAMADALWHIIETAKEALESKP